MEKLDLREELRSYRLEYDLLQTIPCSKQENKAYQELLKNGGALPEGVFPYVYDGGETSTTEFYTVYDPQLTDSEVYEYLTYQKLRLLKTIKSCVMFFTILTIIGLLASTIIVLGAF